MTSHADTECKLSRERVHSGPELSSSHVSKASFEGWISPLPLYVQEQFFGDIARCVLACRGLTRLHLGTPVDCVLGGAVQVDPALTASGLGA